MLSDLYKERLPIISRVIARGTPQKDSVPLDVVMSHASKSRGSQAYILRLYYGLPAFEPAETARPFQDSIHDHKSVLPISNSRLEPSFQRMGYCLYRTGRNWAQHTMRQPYHCAMGSMMTPDCFTNFGLSPDAPCSRVLSMRLST